MPKNFIYFNPYSGLSCAKNFPLKAEAILKKYSSLECVWLNNISDFETISPAEINRVIIIGGDGTIHQVVNYFLNKKIDPPIGIIPQGSTNILARYLQIPNNLESAITVALTGTTVNIDLGLINEKIGFVTCVSWGYLTKLITSTPQSFKNNLGFGGYLLQGLINPRSEKISITVTTKNHQKLLITNSLIVANSLSYLQQTKSNFHDLTDNQLELLSLTAPSLIGLVLATLKILSQRKLLSSKYLFQALTASEFDLENAPNNCQIDGEPYSLKITKIEILHQYLKVVR